MTELLVMFIIGFIIFSTIMGVLEFIEIISKKIESYIIIGTLIFIALPIMPLLFLVFLIRDIVKFVKSKQEEK